MAPVIENFIENKLIGSITESRVKKLLNFLPHEHIAGINKITIVSEITDKKLRNAGGYYHNNNSTISIVLAVNGIYKEMPTFLFYFPFIPNFLLARALYHEVGHHYQQTFSFKTRGKKSEYQAEQYCNKMLKDRFKYPLLLLRPFSSLLKKMSQRSR